MLTAAWLNARVADTNPMAAKRGKAFARCVDATLLSLSLYYWAIDVSTQA